METLWDRDVRGVCENRARKGRRRGFCRRYRRCQFPPESFDVITCFDVLEHLYEPRQVMSKVVKWLKPGGIFYVLYPTLIPQKLVFRIPLVWLGAAAPSVPLLAGVAQLPRHVRRAPGDLSGNEKKRGGGR